MTQPKERVAFREGKQVRLVSDLERSLAYFRDVLGCETDGWGHAIRGGMKLILQQAPSPDDFRPNAASAKRDTYPTDRQGPDHGWDTFIDVDYDQFDALVEELRTATAHIIRYPIEATRSSGMHFKNLYIQDPDGYVIVFG